MWACICYWAVWQNLPPREHTSPLVSVGGDFPICVGPGVDNSTHGPFSSWQNEAILCGIRGWSFAYNLPNKRKEICNPRGNYLKEIRIS